LRLRRGEALAMSKWTTRAEPEFPRRCGVEEIHDVYFEPPVWSKRRTTVSLLIPECEVQVVWMTNGEPVAMVNRPTVNKSVKRWLRAACKMAADENAYLSIEAPDEISARRPRANVQSPIARTI
jgi:hypothetical protein